MLTEGVWEPKRCKGRDCLITHDNCLQLWRDDCAGMGQLSNGRVHIAKTCKRGPLCFIKDLAIQVKRIAQLCKLQQMDRSNYNCFTSDVFCGSYTVNRMMAQVLELLSTLWKVIKTGKAKWAVLYPCASLSSAPSHRQQLAFFSASSCGYDRIARPQRKQCLPFLHPTADPTKWTISRRRKMAM